MSKMIPDTKPAMDPKALKNEFLLWAIGRMRWINDEASRVAVNDMVYSVTDIMEFTQYLLRKQSFGKN